MRGDEDKIYKLRLHRTVWALSTYWLDWSCPWVTFPNVLHIVGSFWVKSGTTMVWGGGRGFALKRV